MNDLKRRITDIESYRITCQSEHEEHHKYRRSTDNKLEGTNAVLTEILAILKEFKEAVPTIKRSKDTYTTLDTLKSWALWIGVISGGFAGVYTLIKMIG